MNIVADSNHYNIGNAKIIADMSNTLNAEMQSIVIITYFE